MVALQALADYATMVYSGSVDLHISAQLSRDASIDYHITQENSLLLFQQDVPVPNTVQLSVRGSGCALLQVRPFDGTFLVLWGLLSSTNFLQFHPQTPNCQEIILFFFRIFFAHLMPPPPKKYKCDLARATEQDVRSMYYFLSYSA